MTVPIDALVHPLCVLPDCGGDPNTYFVVLPKRNWSRYFGDKIKTNLMILMIGFIVFNCGLPNH